MSPPWGHRLVAFIPPLAFAVVPPLVLPRLCDSVSPSPPLVSLVSGGMVSHRLAPVAFPFRLSSALLLDLLVLLSLLDLSPPTHYLILTYQLPYPHLFRAYPTPMDTYPPSYPPLPAGCSHSW